MLYFAVEQIMWHLNYVLSKEKKAGHVFAHAKIPEQPENTRGSPFILGLLNTSVSSFSSIREVV